MGWSSPGAPSRGYEFGIDNTEEQRGRYVARSGDPQRRGPFVTHVFLWNLNWLRPGDGRAPRLRILDNNGAPLPAPARRGLRAQRGADYPAGVPA